MAVKTKSPAKPGYMSTEFWAMVLIGIKTIGSHVGLSPEQVDQTVSSFPDLIGKLGDDPTSSIVLGAVVIVYTIIRGYLKKTKIIADARIEMSQTKKNPITVERDEV